MAWLIDFLPQASPRRGPGRGHERPVMAFTDGAAEDSVTVGGVIFMEGRPPEFFGERVPQELVSKWRAQGESKL